MGLDEKMEFLPSQLSGGEAQRVHLLRWLILGRPILVMDEAFSALDQPLKGMVRDAIVRNCQAFGTTVLNVSHDRADAVGPPIARVAKPVFGVVRRWRIAFEIGARQIIEQHVEGDVEKVPPSIHQMIKHRPLVLEQPVVTPIERVNIAERRIRTEQICQGAALIPLPMEPPLAARREQSVGHEHERT
jgi:ABC transporter family protein